METNKSKTEEQRNLKSESVIQKLKSARKLKDYAISENLDVPSEIIKTLSESKNDKKSLRPRGLRDHAQTFQPRHRPAEDSGANRCGS